VIFIQLESFFHVEGHEAPAGAGAGEATDPWAVSSVVVRLKSPLLAPAFVRDMRSKGAVQAAMPSQEVRKLFGIVSDVDAIFRAVAALVIVVAALATLVGLYNAILARRREIAILRALGARRAGVWGIVTLEAVLICVAGGVAGILLGHAAIAAARPLLQDRYGVIVSAAFTPFDLWVVAGVALLGVVVAVLPAWRAFRVEVARNLHPVD
jgi:putative ABC transport system permease protein